MTREAEGSSPSSRASTTRLYAVARLDLDVGLRTAQVGHVLIAWVLAHGAPPENLVVLAVPDEAALRVLHTRLGEHATPFYEPDLNNQLTAIAVDPSAWRQLSSIPLLR